MRSLFGISLVVALLAPAPTHAVVGDPVLAAQFINALGLDLLSKATPPNDNALLSPYSIQIALAMTYAGADGQTRSEMTASLHYPDEEVELHESLVELQSALHDIAEDTAKDAATRGGDPITFTVANRLFGQSGYDFRESFTGFIRQMYEAPLQLIDFKRGAEGARVEINGWVEKQTHERIRDLIPPGGLSTFTRLVLVNAIYLKASWEEPFPEFDTKPRPFHVRGGDAVDVPTMRRHGRLGYAKLEGYSVVTIPYVGKDLQFLILLPDRADGLRELEAKTTPELLMAASANADSKLLVVELPKLKLEPPVMALGNALQSLGMKTAFDIPPGSANFRRMADDHLFISAVFHKTFLDVDEKGTEAAAATGVAMGVTSIATKPEVPIEVKIDRPFLFAIQHRASGACLFLGRVTDPR